MHEAGALATEELYQDPLAGFLDESRRLLDQFGVTLVQIADRTQAPTDGDQSGDLEPPLEEMFYLARSLSGLSAMLGLVPINTLARHVQDIFDAARKHELNLDQETVDLVFATLDRLVGLVAALEGQRAEPRDVDTLVAALERKLQAARQREGSSGEPYLVEDLGGKQSPDQTPTTDADRRLGQGSGLFGDIHDEVEISPKYLSIFVEETEASLDTLAETLLAQEGGGTRRELEELLVVSHRIKGSAASVGLNRAARLTHLLEDVFQYLVDSGDTLSAELTDAMLKCTDELRQHINCQKRGQAHPDRFAEVASAFLQAQGGLDIHARAAPRGSDSKRPQSTCSAHEAPLPETTDSVEGIPDELRKRVAVAAPADRPTFVGQVVFEPNLPMAGLKAQLVYERISSLGDVCYLDPPLEVLEDLDQLDVLGFGLVTETPSDAISPRVWIAGVCAVLVEPLRAINAIATHGPTESDSARRPAETLRVEIERLDGLMNLAGQLAVSKAEFSQITDRLKTALGALPASDTLRLALNVVGEMVRDRAGSRTESQLRADLEQLRAHARCVQESLDPLLRSVETLDGVPGAIEALTEAVEQLDHISNAVQQSVIDARMMPIGPLFTRIKRVVRDVTRTSGKEVGLVIRGQNTELDKVMIDELSDPLIQLIRNAVDHGIELPDVRRALGKPPQGTICVTALHRGQSVVIQVSDDGEGLDYQGLLRKAVERGIVSATASQNMSPQQICQLIWEHGLSTASQVTEVSGRGVGMDIVKSKVEGLNGSVELASQPGQGTTLTIELPLTLAVLRGMMVETGDEVFAVPVEFFLDTVRVDKRDFLELRGKQAVRIRDRAVPILRLGASFEWAPAEGGRGPEREPARLVVIGEPDCQMALAVDRVIGEADVVIKSLGGQFRNALGLMGASTLGDGGVALILDVAALMEHQRASFPPTLAGDSVKNSPAPDPRDSEPANPRSCNRPKEQNHD